MEFLKKMRFFSPLQSLGDFYFNINSYLKCSYGKDKQNQFYGSALIFFFK